MSQAYLEVNKNQSSVPVLEPGSLPDLPGFDLLEQSEDMLLEIIKTETLHFEGWQITADAVNPWIRLQHARSSKPAQGWKLHLSATVISAPQVLKQALPVLLAETADFKVARSIRQLADLNSGMGSNSQVGKFITIYPADETQAVKLAQDLHLATAGLPGPAVPSDRALRPDSLVYYRYGGFSDRHMQTQMGRIVPALEGPDGQLLPDRRQVGYWQPEWVEDPFQKAGVTAEPTGSPRLLAGNYLLITPIYSSTRGAVYFALDLAQGRRCVLKRARANSAVGLDGRDATHRLRNEGEVLARLAPDPRFPAFYSLIEGESDLYVAMEDVGGHTLESHVQTLNTQGRQLPVQQVVEWGIELAEMLATIHSKGLVYRDLKSPNVMITPAGRLRLLDFELAHPLDLTTPPMGFGTVGYISPQQRRRLPPRVTDDIYGLGALLYFMATGAEPSIAPEPTNLLRRPVRLLNPAVSPALAEVIATCLQADPSRRFSTMAEVATALQALGAQAEVASPALGEEAVLEDENQVRARMRDLARQLGDTLSQTAQAMPDGGRAWRSLHEVSSGVFARDINTGNAGTILALAELVAELGLAEHRQTLVQAANWLRQAPRPEGFAVPGLYVGEAGIGAALLKAGQVLHDPDLIAAAEQRSRLVASMPHLSPDLFNGTAGRLRFHMWVWRETGHEEHLEAARQAGQFLLESANSMEIGKVNWSIPAEYEGMGGQTYVGYAHGTAGIADSLLDLYQVTGDPKTLQTLLGAARWLADIAIKTRDDESGLDWPSSEGQPSSSGLWCHGAAGVGRFFLNLARLNLLPEADEIAQKAAWMVARGTRWAGPVLCHGLAGQIEYLLDVYQFSADARYLNEARVLARLLEAFALRHEGHLLWPSEGPRIFTPDYMVGYAGIALTLLRLSEPERIPYQLSLAGFHSC